MCVSKEQECTVNYNQYNYLNILSSISFVRLFEEFFQKIMEDSVEQENSAELVPNVVIYCKICKMPAEYCVNGSTLPECQAWLSETHVDLCKRLYPELEITEGISQVEVNEDAEAPAKSTKGNKVPKKKAVVIRVVDRTKRKRVTEISGVLLILT